MFTLSEILLLALIGGWAGALNAVAGGGTFFTFPMLLFMGVPPIVANATSKVGLWIGAFGSVRAYMPEIRAAKGLLKPILVVSIVGSVIGSLLLLAISAERFSAMVPWLLLFATLSFAFGPVLKKRFHRDAAQVKASPLALGAQGVIGLYAGFFGAGIGIYMLALFEWMGLKDIHQMNGLKVAAAVGAHTVSALIFIVMGVVDWPTAIILMISAALGGYGGAYLAKQLPPLLIRGFVISYGLLVTGYFFFYA